MPYKFNAEFDTARMYDGPKGNLSAYNHARRLFDDDNNRLSPKVGFLYHVSFKVNRAALLMLPGFDFTSNLGLIEVGLLVKAIELPKFSPQVDTLNKYNQKKNIQTKMVYDPITIQLHDDNQGLTTALLQAYYKYYFVDGNYIIKPSAYHPNNTYGRYGNFRYGLDNGIPHKHFFTEINISQLSRGIFTRFTLVNPLLSKFDHDSMAYEENSKTLQNTMTVNYEAVWVTTGKVDVENGIPDGFGKDHYDQEPSSLTIVKRGISPEDFFPIDTGNSLDLDFWHNKRFNNPFINRQLELHQATKNNNFTLENLRRNRFTVVGFTSKEKNDLSGFNDIIFPKEDGKLHTDSTLKIPTKQIVTTSTEELQNNPAKLDSARKTLYRQIYQQNGGTGGLSAADAEYNRRATDEDFLEDLDSQLGI